ncbi:hypothetical protein B0H14DRAFT_1127937 [Mycena olivaceomarginata]|nr:hypothetical protein B0H14DRAFT_1127937 [Mycena olivaceomarginata]
MRAERFGLLGCNGRRVNDRRRSSHDGHGHPWLPCPHPLPTSVSTFNASLPSHPLTPSIMSSGAATTSPVTIARPSTVPSNQPMTLYFSFPPASRIPHPAPRTPPFGAHCTAPTSRDVGPLSPAKSSGCKGTKEGARRVRPPLPPPGPSYGGTAPSYVQSGVGACAGEGEVRTDTWIL